MNCWMSFQVLETRTIPHTILLTVLQSSLVCAREGLALCAYVSSLPYHLWLQGIQDMMKVHGQEPVSFGDIKVG